MATSNGAVLADQECLRRLGEVPVESLFEPSFWAARGALAQVSGGRGAAWFVAAGPDSWVLRHYRRGGWMARVSSDRYAWLGESRVRSFAEWRMLEELTRLGLPVPAPVAARYQRAGLTYRCDLITRRIAGARPLSAVLAEAAVAEASWRAIGAAVARLHAAGADHADLNAHNILLGAATGVSVIDFDRGSLRRPGPWTLRNLRRLHRSLSKIARRLPADRFPAAAWDALRSGYASG